MFMYPPPLRNLFLSRRGTASGSAPACSTIQYCRHEQSSYYLFLRCSVLFAL